MLGILNNRRFELALIICAAICWGITFFIWEFTPTIERTERHLIHHEWLTYIGNMSYWPDHDMPIYVVMCIVSLLATTATGYVVLLRRNFPELQAAEGVPALSSRIPFVDIGFVLLVLAVVWIPNAQALLEHNYLSDELHHIHFYMMGPLHMYQQGAALGTEVYTQYQSGWILLFSALGNFTTIDHSFVIEVLSLCAAIYFSAWYLVMRKMGFNPIWASLCIMVCLMVQHFLIFQQKYIYTLWVAPSSTVCRNPMDVFIVGSFLYLFETDKIRYAISTGFFVGLSLLFGNDTGVYVTIAALGASVLRLLDQRLERRQTLSQILTLFVTAIAVTLGGLAIASRGTILQANFWSGYYEALRLYSSGFSSRPIKETFVAELSKVHWSILFLSTLVIYTVAISRATVLMVTGKASRLEPLLAFIGVVGFGTLILFINRSHPYNLSHVIVPAFVLWFVEFLRFFFGENTRALSQPSNTANRWGLLLCAACLGIMFFSVNFRSHPSLLNNWSGNFSGAPPTHEFRDLVEQLPQIKRDIEKRLGQETYALVGEDTTLWLQAFNQQSPTRYLPMIAITRAQEETMLKELEDENLICCKKLRNYRSKNDLTRMLERKYSLVESTPDYDIYRRRDLPPLELKPPESDNAKPTEEHSK